MVDTGGASARDQALNLIEYLSAYDAHRHPPVRRVVDHGMFRLGQAGLPSHNAVKVLPDPETWLAVDFIDLPPAPAVPGRIADLLVDGSRITARTEPRPTERPARNFGAEPESADQRATADREWVEHVAPARRWIDTAWRPWAAAWLLAQQVKDLHRSLFEQRERLTIDRDSVELVWGFGQLRWTDREHVPPVVVDHPLLTVPVEIAIDKRTQRATVSPAGPVEVDSRMLLGLDVLDRAGFAAIGQGVIDQAVDPWNDVERDGLLQRLVRTVDDHGLVRPAPAFAADSAVVESSWTIFLRRRLSNSQGFLDAMRQLYREDDGVIPPPLRAILTTEELIGTDSSENDDAGLLLLPLPANEQQERILHLARDHLGVVVQGPPGTGKSHTIANLISHYVADGKRVLVVAEKEQALPVLADKVPPDIRHLTVSVLGADQECRRRLGSSIQHIQTRVSQVDPRLARARITELTGAIEHLDARSRLLAGQLRRTRRAEVDQLPGYGSPAIR